MTNKVISSEAIRALRKDFVAGATLDELMERYSITRHRARKLTAGYSRLSSGTPLAPVKDSRANAHARNRPMPVVTKLTINVTLVVSPGMFLHDEVRLKLSKVMSSLINLAGAEPVAASCHPQYIIVIVQLGPTLSLDEFVANLREGVIDYLESIGVPDAIWLNGYHATSAGDPHAREVLNYVDRMRSYEWPTDTDD